MLPGSMSLTEACFDFGFLGDHRVENKKFEEHAHKFTGYSH